MAALCCRRMPKAWTSFHAPRHPGHGSTPASWSIGLRDGLDDAVTSKTSVRVTQKRFLQRHRVDVATLKDSYDKAKEMALNTEGGLGVISEHQTVCLSIKFCQAFDNENLYTRNSIFGTMAEWVETV